MNIGLVARADSTGLGTQSKGFYDHIPCKVLVIDSQPMSPSQSSILKANYDWYPHSRKLQLNPKKQAYGWMPGFEVRAFLEGLDIVFFMETPYDYSLFDECRKRGIKTILQFNYEFLEYPSALPKPDLFAAPSMWNYYNVPDPKVHLPVPVNPNAFTPQVKERGFVHIGGRAAIHDRNGTQTLLDSLQYIKNEVSVVINTQSPIKPPRGLKSNVKLMIDSGNKKKYTDNYTGGVLVLPRKYGGLCLPINESIGAEMPVITTNISPNNLWLPSEWLVKSHSKGNFKARKLIDIFQADPVALAMKIDQFCEPAFYASALEKVRKIKNDISWDTLRPKYYEVFEKVLNMATV